MSTLPAQPFPSGGLRRLSSKETLQRAQALNCTVEATAKPSCAGQINVGIFFDGTGNNRKIDFLDLPPDKRKHSNVVKIFHAFPDSGGNNFRYYIPGVGTPFPQIQDEGADLGGPFAWNGENRITWGLTRLFNAANRFVNGIDLIEESLAGKIADNMASSLTPPAIRRKILRTWQANLKQAIAGKKPAIEIINLSVFGFSRGAAEARAFCNWLFEVCEEANGGWTFADVPIRLGFLGIFDTVASVGIPNSMPNFILEGHQSWADGNMHINPAIEQCVHFVAGHEVRAAFPLDSVRSKETYPANAKEVMYPGAHSDLGGGYAPNDLGISTNAEDSLAAIPGLQMYHEARKAGVPLAPWNQLSNTEKRYLTPTARVVDSFNSYLKAAKIKPGRVEDLHRKHMSLYLSYRYKYRNQPLSLPFYQRASAKHKGYIAITSDTFNQRLRNFHIYHNNPAVPHQDSKKSPPSPHAYYVDPATPDYNLQESVNRKLAKIRDKKLPSTAHEAQSQLLDVLRNIDPNKLTPEIEHFFGNYVHDSMAGFIEMSPRVTNEFKINGEGILRYRRIFSEDG